VTTYILYYKKDIRRQPQTITEAGAQCLCLQKICRDFPTQAAYFWRHLENNHPLKSVKNMAAASTSAGGAWHWGTMSPGHGVVESPTGFRHWRLHAVTAWHNSCGHRQWWRCGCRCRCTMCCGGGEPDNMLAIQCCVLEGLMARSGLMASNHRTS
jgi:hypothetical protein